MADREHRGYWPKRLSGEIGWSALSESSICALAGSRQQPSAERTYLRVGEVLVPLFATKHMLPPNCAGACAAKSGNSAFCSWPGFAGPDYAAAFSAITGLATSCPACNRANGSLTCCRSSAAGVDIYFAFLSFLVSLVAVFVTQYRTTP